jgi:hypothetical protein
MPDGNTQEQSNEEPVAESAATAPVHVDEPLPTSSESTTPPTPASPLVAPNYQNRTQAEWEAERRKMADVAHVSLNSFLQSSIHQRADLLRDTLAVAVTMLIGSLTLYFTAPDHVRTPVLFFISLFVLTAGIVANLIARDEIVRHLQAVSFQVEKNYIDVYVASRNVLNDASTTNIDTVWRVERDRPAFPELRKRGQYGNQIAVWTIVAAIAGMAAAIAFTIQ